MQDTLNSIDSLHSVYCWVCFVLCLIILVALSSIRNCVALFRQGEELKVTTVGNL